MGAAFLLEELQGINHLYVLADVDALAAQDAAVHVEVQDEAAPILGQTLGPGVHQARDPMLERHVLQLAVAVGVADRTVKRMDREMLFDGLFPGREEIIPIGTHDHPRFGLRCA